MLIQFDRPLALYCQKPSELVASLETRAMPASKLTVPLGLRSLNEPENNAKTRSPAILLKDEFSKREGNSAVAVSSPSGTTTTGAVLFALTIGIVSIRERLRAGEPLSVTVALIFKPRLITGLRASFVTVGRRNSSPVVKSRFTSALSS